MYRKRKIDLYFPLFSPNSLRSRPLRHLGERTTTIPMKTPPLPNDLPLPAISSICPGRKSVRGGGRSFGVALYFQQKITLSAVQLYTADSAVLYLISCQYETLPYGCPVSGVSAATDWTLCEAPPHNLRFIFQKRGRPLGTEGLRRFPARGEKNGGSNPQPYLTFITPWALLVTLLATARGYFFRSQSGMLFACSYRRR